MKDSVKVILIMIVIMVCLFVSYDALGGQDKTESLKKTLLLHEERVNSFKAEYSLSQKGLDDNKFTWKFEQKHELLFKGDIYKWTRNYVHPVDGNITVIFSDYEGIISSLQYTHNVKQTSCIINWAQIPVPQGAYIDPRIATFGYYQGKTLKKRFEKSRLYSWASPQGLDVLTCVADDEFTRYDFYIDQNSRLVKIASGTIPIPKYRKQFSGLYSQHLEQDFFNVQWTMEMSDFVNVDGVEVPLKAVKKMMNYCSAGPKVIASKEDTFKWQFMTQKTCLVEQVMKLKSDSIKVNPELGKKELKVVFPEGALVYDYKKEAPRAAKEKQVKDSLIGKPAPDFPEGTEWLNSKPLSWKDLRGKVVLLDFFAEWCSPCKAELPNLSEMYKKRQEKGIIVIGIHTPGSKLENIEKVIKQYDLAYPICIDKSAPSNGKGFGEISSKYGVSGIPYSFAVDQEGIVVCHGDIKKVFGKALELAKQQSDVKIDKQLKSNESNEIYASIKYKAEKKSLSNAAIYKQLKQNIDLSMLNTNMSFSDAINELKTSTIPPLNIIVLWSDLQENAGINRNSPINIDGISDVSIDTALNLLLWSVEGTAKSDYVVKDGAVIIASKKYLSTLLITEVYDVTDLVSPPAEFYLGMPQYYDDYQMDYQMGSQINY